jgi:uncharacterized membrane protein YeaQ/YmgE (transglycosylase-associated protein family)
MATLFIFAVIGLLTGAAARSLYPGRQVMHILGTMLLGMVGAMAGGMLSWSWWPPVDGEFQTGNLILSALGGMMVIVLGAGFAYKRRLRGYNASS